MCVSIHNLIRLASSAIVLVHFQPSLAQKQVSIGNRVGMTISHHRLEVEHREIQDALASEMRSSHGVSLAIPLEIKYEDYFALQPELGYTMKGYSYGIPKTDEIRLSYIDLTVLAKFMVGSGALGAEFFFGPGFSYGLTARFLGQESAWSPYHGPMDQTYNMGSTGYKRPEALATAGAGLSYAFGAPRVFLNYRYVYGITVVGSTDIIHYPDHQWNPSISRVDAFNRGHVLSLGLLIPLTSSAWVAPVDQ